MTLSLRRLTFALVPLLALTACGDDDDSSPEAAASTSTAPAAPDDAAEPEVPEDVVVRAVDYAFEGLPEEVPAGTKLSLENGSAEELHELVAVKLPDGEERPAAELVALPEEEQAALSSGPPAMVLLRPPGGAPQIDAVGDGTLTEPGRYLFICAIPTGADPAAYMAAAAESQGGPPDVEGGPPHLTKGMFAEVTVG